MDVEKRDLQNGTTGGVAHRRDTGWVWFWIHECEPWWDILEIDVQCWPGSQSCFPSPLKGSPSPESGPPLHLFPRSHWIQPFQATAPPSYPICCPWLLSLPGLQFSHSHSAQFSCSVVFNSLWPHGLQHTRLPCPSPTPGACSNSSPLSQGCHPTISSSVVPFSSCLQSFPASGSFPMSQFFTSGGQCIRVLASASVLPMNIQDWFPLEWTGWISLQSKGLSRVFSNTTVQKHHFGAQLSLWSNSHIHTWPLEKP